MLATFVMPPGKSPSTCIYPMKQMDRQTDTKTSDSYAPATEMILSTTSVCVLGYWGCMSYRYTSVFENNFRACSKIWKGYMTLTMQSFGVAIKTYCYIMPINHSDHV